MSSNQDTKQPIYLKDYQAPDFQFGHVALDFQIEAEHTDVTSTLQVERKGSPGAPMVLDGDDLELLSVSIDSQVLSADRFARSEKTLTIHQVPDQFELVIGVRIYPKQNSSLMGLYESSGNLCTQCEPHGFRRMTYFMDRPDVMTRFTTTITAAQSDYPYLLSNGNLIEKKELDDGKHWVSGKIPP